MSELFKNISRNDIRNIIAVIAVLGAFVILILLILKPIPVENKDTVNQSIGFLFGGLLCGIAGYYYGSSKGDVNSKKSD